MCQEGWKSQQPVGRSTRVTYNCNLGSLCRDWRLTPQICVQWTVTLTTCDFLNTSRSVQNPITQPSAFWMHSATAVTTVLKKACLDWQAEL